MLRTSIPLSFDITVIFRSSFGLSTCLHSCICLIYYMTFITELYNFQISSYTFDLYKWLYFTSIFFLQCSLILNLIVFLSADITTKLFDRAEWGSREQTILIIFGGVLWQCFCPFCYYVWSSYWSVLTPLFIIILNLISVFIFFFYYQTVLERRRAAENKC